MYKSFQSTPHKLKFLFDKSLQQEHDIIKENELKSTIRQYVQSHQSQNNLFNKFENLGDSDWQEMTTISDETGIAYSYKNWTINFPIIDLRTISYYTPEILLKDETSGDFFIAGSDYFLKYYGWDIKSIEGEDNLVEANFNYSIFLTRGGQTTIPNFQCKLLLYYVNAGLR
jgi:hypothetical protein